MGEINVIDVRFLFETPSREGKNLSVWRPLGIAIGIWMARQVVGISFSVGGSYPDIAIKIRITFGVGDPFSVWRPLVLYGAPRLDQQICVLTIGVRTPEVASPNLIADLFSSGNKTQIMFCLSVFGDLRFSELAILPPVVLGVGLLGGPDICRLSIIPDEKNELPVGAHDWFSFLSRCRS